ncbi:MAG: prephenate dehydrogenase dimerization domain-containing protein, partial [Actinomycetes bacterium]
AFARLHGIVSDFGASPMALTAAEHDRLVAMVSHLPHLVAVTLMNQAHEAAAADPALLRLAAGGFRDMTRVASGDPRIWPDLVLENQTAILEGIKGLQDGLEELSKALRTGNRAVIAQRLSDAQIARRSLPVAHQAGGLLNAIRVPVSNRTGVLSDITTAASSRNVSILDIEIAHSAESAGGVLVLVIERKDLEALGDELSARGYRFSSVEIEP